MSDDGNFEFPIKPPADTPMTHDWTDACADPLLEFPVLSDRVPRPALMTVRIRVKPYGLQPSQLEALATTLKMLAHGGDLVRERNGMIVLQREGWVAADVVAPDFVIFAIKRQGYAIDAERWPEFWT